MGNNYSDTLNLVRDVRTYLASCPDFLLAAQEDADYFRKRYQKPVPPPQFVPVPVPVAPPAPLPEIKKAIEKEPELPSPPEPPPISLKSLKNLLSTIAPSLSIIDEIPNDAIAKKIKTRWKTKNQVAPITVLHYQELPEHKTLLEQIGKALDVCFGPAKLVSAESIEKEKQWETFLASSELKLVICCDYTLWQLEGLMQHYREVPAQKTRMLKDKQLFLLPDLSLYLKDPLLKRSLWKGLLTILAIR